MLQCVHAAAIFPSAPGISQAIFCTGGTMKEYITRFCEEYHYPVQAVQTLTDTYEAAMKSPSLRALFDEAREAYALSPDLDYLQYLNALKTACTESSLSWESISLLFYICLVPQLAAYYAKRQLPEALCRASLEDLKWKLQECRQVYGLWGSFVPDWFAGFFRLTRFTLGRLQFELTSFPKNYVQCGRTKPEGMEHAINIHIPSSGPLLHEDCLHSYRLAADFFRSAFPGKKTAFICYSWLLYPEHYKFLPRHSRILDFMADFDIYDTDPDPAGGDLWRIFGLADCSDTAKLPEKTSLQQAYKKWLLNGNPPGTGTGLFFLNGESLP